MALTKVPSNLDATIATTQSASDNSTNVATTAYVTTAIANLVDGAPSTLNTLDEIAAALNDDAALNTTLTNSIATKMPLAGGTFTGNVNLTKETPYLNLTDSSASRTLGIFVDDNNSVLRSSGQLLLQIGSQSAITIDSGKRVGVNQVPAANNFTLQVKGVQTDGTDGRVAYFKGYGTQTSIGSTGPTVVIQNANQTANNYAKLSFESAGAGETVSINAQNIDHTNHYGDMAFNTRGSGGYSEKMRIKANGNVGIGTTAPHSKLHLVETASGAAGIDFPLTISSDRYQADYGVGIAFRPENQSTGYKVKTALLASGGGYGYNQADLHFCLNSDNQVTTEVSLSDAVMTIKKGGKVGIGTTSPSRNLTVSSSGQTDLAIIAGTSASAQLQFGDSGDDNIGQIEYNNSTNDMKFSTNATERMCILDTGEVGIGTMSPDTALEVESGASASHIVRSKATVADGYRVGFEAQTTHTGGGHYSMFTTNNGDGYFGGGKFVIASETMGDVDANTSSLLVLDSSGNVGIKETSPDAVLTIGGSGGYVQEWKKAKGFKQHDTPQSGANGNYNESTYINVLSYRGVLVDYYESGHYFNNGAAYYFRHSKIYVIMEGSTLRVADVVLERSTGNVPGAIVNAPTVTSTGTGQFTITSTILSGYTHYVSVDAVGAAFVSIGNIG